jgi:hypothetical protein
MELIDPFPPDPAASSVQDEYRRLAASKSCYEARIGTMMLEFLDRLRHGVTGPRLGVIKMSEELWLQYADGQGHSTLITVRIDHKDYSPLVDGVPPMHYRLASTRFTANLQNNLPKVELQTSDVETASDFVLEAIRNCKGPL